MNSLIKSIFRIEATSLSLFWSEAFPNLLKIPLQKFTLLLFDEPFYKKQPISLVSCP